MPKTFLEVALAPEFVYKDAIEQTQAIRFEGLLITIGYVVVIFSIKAIMNNFKPFDLTPGLNAWNAWLAIFSTLGSLVTGYGLAREIFNHGLVSSYCHAGDYFQGTVGLWTWLFCLSKIAELGDTIFIVLRKKPLMFLHWYHHVLTLNYGLLSFVENTAFNTWIVWLNFTVHSAMYGYYMLRSLGVKIPAAIARLITVSQITQFIITLAILFHVGYIKATGGDCDVTPHTYLLCLGMEISYVVLFGNFFYHSYIKGGGKKFVAEKKTTKVDEVKSQ